MEVNARRYLKSPNSVNLLGLLQPGSQADYQGQWSQPLRNAIIGSVPAKLGVARRLSRLLLLAPTGFWKSFWRGPSTAAVFAEATFEVCAILGQARVQRHWTLLMQERQME